MHKSSLLKNQNAVTKLEKTGNKEQMTSAFGARYPSLRVIPPCGISRLACSRQITDTATLAVPLCGWRIYSEGHRNNT